jgi:hypothetical protein
MGKNEVIQVKADEDDCVYLYDAAAKTWQKICDVKTTLELPDSVKRKVREMQSASY